jgi:catechol 2,3-dioxygenase-like lactoylglutathione lyase family enzyme
MPAGSHVFNTALPEKDKTMKHIIAKLLHEFEQGKMNRRQLIQHLALAASAAAAVSAVPAAAAEGKVLNVTNINHVSYQVTDYARTRDFYAGLFGMKVSEDDGKQCRLSFGNNILVVRNRLPAPKVDHIAYTIANWDEEKEAVEAEVKRRGLKIVQGDIKTSLHILDPDGLGVQFGGTRQ